MEVDLPGFRDGGDLVVLHQLVEGGELLRPQEVLAFVVFHHFEVLDVVLVSEGKIKHAGVIPSFQRFSCSLAWIVLCWSVYKTTTSRFNRKEYILVALMEPRTDLEKSWPTVKCTDLIFSTVDFRHAEVN